MATQRYPSRNDEEALTQANQIIENAGRPEDIGLTAADITRLTTARDEGQTAYDLHITTQQTARAKRTDKDGKIDKVQDILSEFNGRVQVYEKTTDADRTRLGFPIYDKTQSIAARPSDLPFVKIDNSMPMAQLIHFADEDGKGKPEGVKAAEIHQKIGGDATGNIEDYRFLVQDSESPYLKEFTNPADAGKQAHYMICWINSKGERGSFQLASATITSLLQSSGG